MTVSRPIVRYHGGKWRLAPWIIAHFPAHRTYVEPFGGAASVLLRKQPSAVEVLNDLNGDMINGFRVIRDPEMSVRLAELLRATPCSEEEFRAAAAPTDDPVERARRTIVRGQQGHGSTGVSGGKKTGWRRGVRASGTASSREWAAIWEHVGTWCDRLREVYIERAPAIEVMTRWDADDTLHYVDPPYLADTRTTGNGAEGYAHELSDQDHIDLAGVLRALRGAVVLSGYPSPLYHDLYRDWHRIERIAQADRAAVRVECLWLSPLAARVLVGRQESISGISA